MQRQNWWTPTQYYLERLGAKIRWRNLLFYERELEPHTPSETLDAGNVVALSVHQVRMMKGYAGWLTREAALSELQSGKRWLFGAVQGETLLGTCWVEVDTSDLRVFDLSARLVPGSAHITHVYVDPAARGRRLAQQMIATAARHAQQMGCSRAVLCCVPENKAMIRVMQQLGWRQYQNSSYRRLLLLRCYVFRSTEDGDSLATWRSGKAQRLIMNWGSRPDQKRSPA